MREPDEERIPEKPNVRMLVYWGCGDAVRPGQPKVANTEKMSLLQALGFRENGNEMVI